MFEIPKSYHGESLTTSYGQPPKKWRSSIFIEHQLSSNPLLIMTDGYRDETWKFIRYENNPEFIELYNLKEDVNETNNLAYDNKYTDRVKLFQFKCDSIVSKLLADRVS